jgi:hypothetical protein
VTSPIRKKLIEVSVPLEAINYLPVKDAHRMVVSHFRVTVNMTRGWGSTLKSHHPWI